jgi:nitrous oxidase accessory protein NosD
MNHRSTVQPRFFSGVNGYGKLLVCMFLFPSLIFAGKSIDVPSGKYKTITEAMMSVSSGDTIWVEPGTYNERVVVYPGVALKSRTMHKAIINGGQHGTVVTLGKRASVTGFDIRNGTIGVFSKSVGNAVTRCRIVYNWQTGVMCVRNLAKIEDNIIAFNGASGIQLYQVAVSTGAINHNTIAFNSNHGIAIGENSPAIIQNNIIAFNERFGVVLQGKSKDLRIVSNDIFGNIIGSPPLPPENFSFDPGFTSPRWQLDFTATSKSAVNRKGVDNEVLGARFFN